MDIPKKHIEFLRPRLSMLVDQLLILSDYKADQEAMT